MTKLTAARIASAAGCKTVIGKSTEMEKIIDFALGLRAGDNNNNKEYTLFLAAADAAKGKKRWMLSLPVKDRVRVNKEGEEDIKSGEPLLVKNVLVGDASNNNNNNNSFKVQDCIIVEDEEGREIARAIVNYSAEDLNQQNLRLSDAEEEFVHTSNLCVTHFNEEYRSVSRNN